jgi:hypothetical protein
MQRAHKEQVQPFAQWLLARGPFQVGQGLEAPPGVEQQRETLLGELQAPLGEAHQLRNEREPFGQSFQRCAAPEPERVAQEVGRARRVGVRERCGARREVLHPSDVDMLRTHLQPVPARPPADPVGAEHPP